MPKNETQQFITRWGLVFALLGNVVGAGNIWRFPRMAALNGGGAFVLAWTIVLVVFSIPLMACEHIMGRATRQGPPGAFAAFMGKKFAWLGMFLTCCGFGIGCYYAVVTGWAIKYLIGSLTGGIFISETAGAVAWEALLNSGGQQVLFQFIAMAIAFYFLYRGVGRGIELISKVLMPLLYIMLLFLAIYSLTLPDAIQGLKYLFQIDPEYLTKSNTWLQALSQSAWSVGPGWGLTLAYAAYVKPREDLGSLPMVQGFGDNSAALLAGITVSIIVFSFSASAEAGKEIMLSGNQGLLFIHLPKLFFAMPGGRIAAILFFGALVFGAITSLMAMMEVLIISLVKWGWKRSIAVTFTCSLGFALGIPSALSFTFFNNQDWVFGVALLFGCLFTALAVAKFGAAKARKNFINIPESGIKYGAWWDFCITYVVPVLFCGVFIWWIAQSMAWYPGTWWQPFAEATVGTIVFQVGIILIILALFNKKMAKAVDLSHFNGKYFPPIPED